MIETEANQLIHRGGVAERIIALILNLLLSNQLLFRPLQFDRTSGHHLPVCESHRVTPFSPVPTFCGSVPR